MDFFNFNEALLIYAAKNLPKSTIGAKMAWMCLAGNRITRKHKSSAERRQSLGLSSIDLAQLPLDQHAVPVVVGDALPPEDLEEAPPIDALAPGEVSLGA